MEKAVIDNDCSSFVEALLNVLRGSAEVQVLSEDDDVELVRAKDFLTKSCTILNSKITEQRRKTTAIDASALGAPSLELEDLQLVEPRGRFQAKFYGDQLVLTGKAGQVIIASKSIAHAFLVPCPSSTKKEGEDYLAVFLRDPVQFAGKGLNKLLFNLSRAEKKSKPSTQPSDPADLTSSSSEPAPLEPTAGKGGIESVVVSQAFAALCKAGTALEKASPRFFTSSMQRKAFVPCHRGTQEGVLYPMPSGLLFVKPLLLLSAGQVETVGMGRVGGSTGARYLDLTVTKRAAGGSEGKWGEGKSQHEVFSNIDRDELPALQQYLASHLLPLARQLQGEGFGAAGGGAVEDDDSDDSDYDPDAPDSEEEDNRGGGGDDDSDEDNDDGASSGSAGSGGDSDDEEEEEEEEEEVRVKGKVGKKRPLPSPQKKSKETKKESKTVVKKESSQKNDKVAQSIAEDVIVLDAPAVSPVKVVEVSNKKPRPGMPLAIKPEGGVNAAGSSAMKQRSLAGFFTAGVKKEPDVKKEQDVIEL